MKIAMLISGGVDSAVALLRLIEQGHELHLYYIRIGRDDDEGDCPAEEDIEMCTLIARRYGLPLKVVSLHEEYWAHVMQYALDTAREGLTPHPDLMCNKLIKFGFFEQRWGHEYEMVATGHYASTVEREGFRWLATAVDPVKDQTDFLAQISYHQLCHIIFPLGDIPKQEVRRIAAEAGLPNAARKDSQGICFLGKINYNDFIRRHLGERPGPIVEIETGRKIGEHRGYWFHTIGQRKGLGLSGGPWYVVRKNTRDNVIYVSRGYDTRLQYGRTIHLQEMHWITLDPFADGGKVSFLDPVSLDNGTRILDVSFKNRHSPEFAGARLILTPTGDMRLEAESDVQGIAPGQYAVIYTPDHDICLGSGMIVAPPAATRRRRHRAGIPAIKNDNSNSR